MKRILILTKNILSESNLQEKLQSLNFEVYCSSCLLERLLKKRSITEYIKDFDFVIISDLVTDKEVLQISSQLSEYNLNIFRKTDSEPTSEEESYMERIHLSGWVKPSMSKEKLRELFSGKSANETIPVGQYESNAIAGGHKVSIANLPLSRLEKEFLQALYENESDYLSREDASERLWGKCDQSTMSRLSMMKKSIENKLLGTNIPTPLFVTEWGKGYRAKENFFKYLVR
ncbi:helix-turn-helix domain-containing protein [Enterococcus sp. AZ109]|uniref:helix-turn-helix domain-containing protein n=1 Tax=Enterococcus sp. AZ109 TaxID=2774634 RepID=UPI003F211BAB